MEYQAIILNSYHLNHYVLMCIYIKFKLDLSFIFFQLVLNYLEHKLFKVSK